MNVFKKNLKSFVFILALVLSFINVYSQEGRLPTKQEFETKERLTAVYTLSKVSPAPNHLLTTGPEQDCDNAIPVCSPSYTQNTSYSGYGIQEVSNSTCLGSRESNSVWYVFTVQNSGDFSFNLITPNDYDYALYDITTIGCSGVPGATPIRCNFSATYGNTGLTLPASATIPLSNSASGSPTMPGVNVTAGQTFALIIDNYSANTQGYVLTFGGTATIFDVTPPTITSTSVPCNGNTFRVNFSEPSLCSSIAANGSDFILTGPLGIVPITSAIGNLCSTGASNTNYATVTFNNAGLTTGVYTVNVAAGTDGNTIIDKCTNSMSTAQSFTFTYLAPINITATSTLVCSGSPSTLTINGVGGISGANYTWAPLAGNQSTLAINPTSNNTYLATVTYGGCTRNASVTINIQSQPVVTINPNNVSLCSGTTPLVASATIGGAACATCSYTWTGTTSQTDNNVASSTIATAGAGSYSVTVNSSAGCLGNTAVSNVSILSPSSPPSCDIIYVTPTGGGTGLDKLSPTTIQIALTMAACNAITIKMAVGDYSISIPLNLNSYVTMEGGFNTAFTLKTSSTGTTGVFPNRGTRIYRTTTSPEGSAGDQRLTAINVAPGSSNFRLQDLTLEVQNSVAGSKISNYGIYLGSGCSNYNIIRCKIDAGKGSDGISGTNGINGINGGNGGTGDDSDGGRIGGSGGTSSVVGGIGGSGGYGGFNGDWYFDNNSNGTYESPPDVLLNPTYWGTNGYGGGSSQYANYGVAGTGNGGQVSNSETNFGGCDNRGAPYNGTAATAAVVSGTNGVNGTNGNIIPAYAAGYFTIGPDGTSGTSGSDGSYGMGGGGGGYQNVSFDETGAGGGGGGGAGKAGTAGTGGIAAGAAFGIFSVNKGIGSNITDCYISANLSSTGVGGTGGSSSTGGSAGSGGSGCDGGAGGNGTAGGAGGSGGNGGSGSVGAFCLVCDLNGTVLSTIAHTNFSLTSQSLITAENIACSNIDIDYTTTGTAPINWTNFGTTSVPSIGTGTPFNNVQYTGLGRKTISLNSAITNTITIPVAAQSFTNTAASAGLGTTACPTAINNTINVSGYTNTVTSSGISIKVSTASHNYFSDVSMYLVAPSGQILGLTNNRGNNGACSLTNISFLDAGATVMAATCPAAGSSFKPETTVYTDCAVTSNITTFGAIGGGSINPNGNWILRLVDNASSDGGAAIATNGWTLNIPAYSGTTTSTGTQADNYTDFVNIQVAPPGTGSILASSSAICPGAANFASSVAGTAGLTYSWSASPATTTISANTATSTAINFVNTGSTPITYTITLGLASQCCGTLTPITQTIIVHPIPAAPTASASPVCNGGLATFSATAPTGVVFDWYNNAGAGTLLGTGNSYTIASITTATTVYVGATNSGGCSSTLTPVALTPTNVPAPTALPSLACETGIVLVGITPASGVTDYNWYSDAGGITLIQTGSSLNYGQNIATAGGSYTVYAQSNIIGCTPSGLIPVTGSVSATPIAGIISYVPSGTVCTGSSVTLSVSPTGGNGSYTYTWSPTAGSTASIVLTPTVSSSNLVTVESSGCSKTFNVPIIVEALPTVTASASNSVICNGANTSLTAGGTASTYTWTGGVINGVSFTPTVTSTYTVTGSTGSGCSNTTVVTVTVNAIPTSTASVTGSVTCLTTAVNLNSTNVSGASYTWTPPSGASILSPGANVNNTIGDGAGTYTLDVQSSAGCNFSTTVSVSTETTLPTGVSAGASQTLICGSANVTLAGTATPTNSTINWLGGVCGSATSLTTTACAPNTYTLVVLHPVSGCSVSSVMTVSSSTDVPQATIDAITNSITCTNSVVAIGVTSPDPVNYSWTGPGISGSSNTSATTATLAGTYTVVITNSLTTCSTTLNATVQSDVTTVTVTATAPGSITCTNTVVTLSSSPIGSSYTYTWSGTGISTSINAPSVDVTQGGNFVVTITNTVNGCPSSFTISVPTFTTPPTVTVTPSSYTTSCAFPTVQLVASSISGDLTYSWTPNGGTLDFTTISNPIANGGGTYDVVVTNTISGCQSTATATVIPDAAVPTVSVSSNSLTITCTNSIVTSAITSTNTTLSYTWDPAPLTGGANPTFDTQAIYNATITASNGCSTYTTINVGLNNTIPTVTLSSTTNQDTLTCSKIQVVVNPNIPSGSDLTYTWSPSAGISTPLNQASATFTASGIYTLAITNTLTGCVTVNNSANTFTVFTDTIRPTATINVISTNSIIGCGAGNAIVTLSCSVTSSNTPIITWLPVGVSTATLDVTSADVYSVIVVDAVNSCSTTSAPLTVNGNTTTPQNVDAGTLVSMPCGSLTVSLTGTTTSSNTNYSWSGPSATSIVTGSNTSNPEVNEVGNYTLTVTDNLTGCESTATVNVSQANVTAAFTANPTSGASPLTVNFTDASIGATSYSWNFGDTNTSLIQNPSNIYMAGTYTVILTALSGACTSTASIVIVVEDGLTIEIPNVFTPNDDNSNDIFTIKSTGVKEISLQIFNRWGQKLYGFSGPKASWDGLNNQGNKVPEGTYFYFVKVTGFDDKMIEKNGTVSLFR